MEALYTAYLDLLRNVHHGMKRSMEGLPQEAIDWVPGDQMGSMGGLVVHTVGTEMTFLKQAIAGEPVERDRAAEWATQGTSAAELAAMMDQSEAVAERVLAGLALKSLAEERTLRADRKVTVAYALLHNLDHGGDHLGHMQITRQLWDQRK